MTNRRSQYVERLEVGFRMLLGSEDPLNPRSAMREHANSPRLDDG